MTTSEKTQDKVDTTATTKTDAAPKAATAPKAAKAAPKAAKAAPKAAAPKAAKAAAPKAAANVAAPVEKALKAPTEAAGAVVGKVTDYAGNVSHGLRVYYDGLADISCSARGYGKDLVTDTVEHAKASANARNIRDLAELQAAFAQRRIELATSHVTELAELFRTTLTRSFQTVRTGDTDTADKAA